MTERRGKQVNLWIKDYEYAALERHARDTGLTRKELIGDAILLLVDLEERGATQYGIPREDGSGEIDLHPLPPSTLARIGLLHINTNEKPGAEEVGPDNPQS